MAKRKHTHKFQVVAGKVIVRKLPPRAWGGGKPVVELPAEPKPSPLNVKIDGFNKGEFCSGTERAFDLRTEEGRAAAQAYWTEYSNDLAREQREREERYRARQARRWSSDDEFWQAVKAVMGYE